MPFFIDFARDIAAIGMPKDTHRKFCSSRAHKPSNANDFSFADHQIEIFVHDSICIDRMMNGPILHFKKRITNLGMPFRIAIRQVTTNHPANDSLFRNLIASHRFNGLSIAQNRDAIGDIDYFIQLMRNNDGSNPLITKFFDQF